MVAMRETAGGPIEGVSAKDLALAMQAQGLALVDATRTTFLIDQRVHEGVLWRLDRLRRQHPPRLIVSATVWRGLMPETSESGTVRAPGAGYSACRPPRGVA